MGNLIPFADERLTDAHLGDLGHECSSLENMNPLSRSPDQTSGR
jgi:hypothetical protein